MTSLMLASAPVAQPTSSPRAPRVEFWRRAPVGGGVQAIGAMAVRRALTRVAAVRAPQHLASRFAPAPSTSTRVATRVRTAVAFSGRAFEPRRAFSAAAAERAAAGFIGMQRHGSAAATEAEIGAAFRNVFVRELEVAAPRAAAGGGK